ncbi:MAG: polyprenyl synthetase family protein [Candidatus Thermoplasmatota archaeon]|nr:polyprenyl synthetase family protein [Candidatus Thermoplasmatota archaeon]
MPPGLPARVTEDAARLKKQLDGVVSTLRQADLREAARHYPQAGGKAVRPVLTLLACEAAGGDPQRAEPLALAVELLHTFSLVHDDLMDHDEVRRGVPAVHVQWDMPMAILAGDALYALSFEQAARLAAYPGGSGVMMDLATTARTLCEGQTMDMAFEHDWPELATYETMIERKTAALFALSTGGGARLAGASDNIVEALATFGLRLGLAFQVQDDVLDITSDTETLGKPQGSDILAGKKTHPIIAAHGKATPRERERLEHLLEKGPGQDEAAWVLDLCERTGSIATSAVDS